MLDFKNVTFEDIETVRGYFDRCASHSSDYTTGIIYMWRGFYDMKFARCEDALIFSLSYDGGKEAFLLPHSERFEKVVRETEDYCRETGKPMHFYSVEEEMIEKIKSVYPECRYYAEDMWADYVYEADMIKNLTGKKYSTQRNHINKFNRLYPDYTFEEITQDDIDACVALSEKRAEAKEDEQAVEETKAVKDVLDNLGKYGFLTGILKVDGVAVGFSCGEIINDMLTVHIEKADTSFDGVYPVLTHLFLEKYADEKVKYVNREDDSGDEGLRKSKLSYHPCKMVKKYFVEIDL
ncbi:MAG: DUF2156 domain-containing protein [Clostridia bacterium]|nr:DUF2156 domain-containing protein [Clostridia bacterium]